MPPKKAATKTAESEPKVTKTRAAKKGTVSSTSEVEPEESKKKAPRPRAAKKNEEEAAAEKETVEQPRAKVTKRQASKDSDSGKAEPSVKKTKSTRAKKVNEEVKENGADKKKAVKTVKKAVTKKVSKEEEHDSEDEVAELPKRAKRGKKQETENIPSEEPKAEKKTKSAPKKKKADEPEAKVVKNATETDWDKVNFSCSLKNANGKSPNFHITCWNIGGVRAWLKKGGLDLLHHDNPDVLCLQEVKCSQDKLPEELNNIEGYKAYWCNSEKEGYAGVGLLSKVAPMSVEYGIKSDEHDIEGRCITAEFEKFYLVNTYVPNAGRKLVSLPKRLEWNKHFKEYINNLNKTKPVIICGDMNVAHTEIDLANPKTNTKNAGFTVEEREGMTEFLAEGYVDTFRKLYPDQEKAYTFWTYMSNARAKNVGWRLDYFIVSEGFMGQVCDNMIHNDVLGSDHCPLSLHINI